MPAFFLLYFDSHSTGSKGTQTVEEQAQNSAAKARNPPPSEKGRFADLLSILSCKKYRSASSPQHRLRRHSKLKLFFCSDKSAKRKHHPGAPIKPAHTPSRPRPPPPPNISLHGVLLRELDRRPLELLRLLPHLRRYIRLERMVRIRTEHRPPQHLDAMPDVQRRSPTVPDQIGANLSVLADVGMVNLGEEFDLGWFEGVLRGKFEVQREGPVGVGGGGRTEEVDPPVVYVVPHDADRGVVEGILFEVGALLFVSVSPYIFDCRGK